MVKQIPNLITSLNLLCGCVALFFAISGDMVTAALFVFAGIFFDFFDGLAARLLNAHSDIGLQFDSLADMVTSGAVPAAVMVQLLSLSLTGSVVDMNATFSTDSWNAGWQNYWPFFGLLIAVASGYRLAKFNVDTRQTTSFIGLPTPANALLILSMPLILKYQPSEIAENLILNPWILFATTVLSCILLNAEISLFALKFKSWDFKSNVIRYVFLAICIITILLLKFIAIPVILLVYVFLSLVWKPSS